MDESFRRAIRKFTGRSVTRLSDRPDRTGVVSFLSSELDPTWSIALREHLERADPDSQGVHDFVSASDAVLQQASAEFPGLASEFRDKFAEFRDKWLQRSSAEAMVPLFQQGRWIIPVADGSFQLPFRATAHEVRNLYYETLHFLVGDAEKLFVSLSSRLLHLQDRLAATWHSQIADTPSGKVLPALERSLRGREAEALRELRGSLATLAFRRFQAGVKVVPTTRNFPTAVSVVRHVGASWDPVGAWDCGFQAFASEATDFSLGLCQVLCDWYLAKWTLYSRGFSRGQLDLFGSLRSAPAQSLENK